MGVCMYMHIRTYTLSTYIYVYVYVYIYIYMNTFAHTCIMSILTPSSCAKVSSKSHVAWSPNPIKASLCACQVLLSFGILSIYAYTNIGTYIHICIYGVRM